MLKKIELKMGTIHQNANLLRTLSLYSPDIIILEIIKFVINNFECWPYSFPS